MFSFCGVFSVTGHWITSLMSFMLISPGGNVMVCCADILLITSEKFLNMPVFILGVVCPC